MTIKEAVTTLIDRADDLIAAIEGTTDQFDLQIMNLNYAISEAEDILAGGAL